MPILAATGSNHFVAKMPRLRKIRDRLEGGLGRTWDALTEGWREILSRSTDALTHFDSSRSATGRSAPRQDFPQWSVLAAETWETAQALIIRIELPGMNREDIDVSIGTNALTVRGIKRSEGEHHGRLYGLMERAYGRFERTIALSQKVDRERAEISYKEGVLTVIAPKTDPKPPRPG